MLPPIQPVRLLVDASLSVTIADQLRRAGHDVVHVRDVGLRAASDEEILAAAHGGSRVVVAADGDFDALLAHHNLTGPSLIRLRSMDRRPAGHQQAQVLLRNLAAVEADLARGAIVTVARGRLRVRLLPVHGDREQQTSS